MRIIETTMHKILLNLFLIFFFIIVNNCFAENTGKKPISGIIITGNDHTKESVITRELLFTVGDTPNDSLLEFSKNRLMNLGLFSRVEFYYLPSDKGVDLLILVHEQLYIFPYPIFTVVDRDWSKITYGGGVTYVNLFGENHKLNASLSFGYNPGCGFGYKIPWLGEKEHFYFGLFATMLVPERKGFFLFETRFFLIGSSLQNYNKLFYSLACPHGKFLILLYQDKRML